MKPVLRSCLLALACALPTFVNADPLQDAVNHSDRTGEQRLRDEYRHPQQTLRFFGITPTMHVAEISPGGGWYTNILAPLLKEQGMLYAAHYFVDQDTREYFRKSRAGFEKKVAEQPAYSNVKVTDFHPVKAQEIAPEGSLDAVLTFRNVHSWYMRGGGDENTLKAFEAFFKALKKGGTLGVVEHRLPESSDDSEQEKSGYMKQSYVIEMAKKAGFVLDASSEINGNPLDTASHPRGVWSLLPNLAMGEEEKEKYMSIGESDRMTLKFTKP